MKENRRMKRMARASKQKIPTLNEESLNYVFTIMVVFMLVNSASSDIMEQPKNVKLPESVVDSKPRETVIVLVTEDSILVQGDVVMSTAEVIESKDSVMQPIIILNPNLWAWVIISKAGVSPPHFTNLILMLL